MDTRYAVLPLLVALAGCASYGQRVAAACSDLGMPPGSSEYPACVHHVMDLQQRNQEMWGGAALAGAAMTMPPQPVYVIGR